MSLFYKTVIQITLLLLTLLPAAITGASDRATGNNAVSAAGQSARLLILCS